MPVFGTAFYSLSSPHDGMDEAVLPFPSKGFAHIKDYIVLPKVFSVTAIELFAGHHTHKHWAIFVEHEGTRHGLFCVAGDAIFVKYSVESYHQSKIHTVQLTFVMEELKRADCNCKHGVSQRHVFLRICRNVLPHSTTHNAIVLVQQGYT